MAQVEHEDERQAWQGLQCRLAKAARHRIYRPITNRAITLDTVLSLIGKCNATPIDRIPAGQARLIEVPFERCLTNQFEYHAVLEYSPLGWPEETGDLPAFVVCPTDPERLLSVEQAHRLQLQLSESRRSGKVVVLDSSVTITPVSPLLPAAELNVLFADPVAESPESSGRREFL